MRPNLLVKGVVLLSLAGLVSCGSTTVPVSPASNGTGSPTPLLSPSPAASSPVEGTDALERRVLGELSTFTGWLERYGVKGYIGEVGWPDDSKGDASSWNALADTWFRKADAAGLWVTVWATGEWWGTGYSLAAYERTTPSGPVDRPDTQARVIERHPAIPPYGRGINLAGGESGAPATDPHRAF